MNPNLRLSIIIVLYSTCQAHKGAVKLANETGKRYICSQCGSEFIVTKGGSGSIICCTQQMELKR